MKKARSTRPNLLLREAREARGWTQQEVADRIGVPYAFMITRWEKGVVFPSAIYREKLAALFGRTMEELGLLPGQRAREKRALSEVPWALSLPRNPYFTGREEILHNVHSMLSGVSPSPVALSGLGGIGKTQVAIEYAYRYGQEYHAIFWIEAETVENVISSFLRIAALLALPEQVDGNQQRIVAAVQRWLSTHRQWLLIWDNVEDLDVLQQWVPQARQGASLITTRRKALGMLARRRELVPMEHEEGMLFVLQRANILEPGATREDLHQLAVRMPTEYESASVLGTALGGLPLALDQAGAYIDETGCSLSTYLQRYEQQRGLLLARRGDSGEHHPHSVTATFRLSSGRVEQEQPAAADLLRMCAFLQAEGIPEELFVVGSAHLGPVLEPVTTDPTHFDRVIAALRNLSLMQRHAQNQTLSLHRLVQAVLQESMSEEERMLWSKRVIGALNTAFPEGISQTRQQCERLLPHILTVAAATPESGEDAVLGELLRKTADYLCQRAQYQQAEALFQRALRLQEEVLGMDHLQTAASLSGLAFLYHEQGKHEQAEALYQQALHIRERIVGPEHPEVARTLSGLAALQRDQGKYEQAEAFYERALHIWEQTLDPAQPEMARTLNGLATLWMDQGKYEQAEPLYERALRIREQVLGPEHPEVAVTLNNLATLWMDQGKYEQAEPLYERALHVLEQTVGPEHPDTAYPLNNLAEIYAKQKNYEQAEQLSHRALSIWEQAFGSEHRLVAYPLNNLAAISHAQGNLEQAERLYQQALHIREHALVAKHPETIFTINNLASVYQEQGKYKQAEALYQVLLPIREQASIE